MNWLRRHGKELAIGLIGALILLTVYLTGMTYSSYMAVVREEMDPLVRFRMEFTAPSS